MSILITGAAGFIGFNISKKLIENGQEIIGLDNFNSYYDPKLKEARYKELIKISQKKNIEMSFYRNNLENKEKLENIFSKHNISTVINLAAQAGVRYSIDNPSAYIQSNLVGFGNILECCRHHQIKHLIYASSSSVYGGNKKMPFSENDSVDHPISLYAASKRANELMAHTYSNLYQLPTTGLRFFTVYGPWGRPDMALFLFVKAILEGEPINVFNNGNMTRDFTYIDDITESLFRLIDKPPKPNSSIDKKDLKPSFSWSPFRIFNIGNSNPTQLIEYINTIESSLNKKALINFLPMQQGDVESTFSDTTSLESWIDFKPNTPISKGISEFVSWFREFYNI